MEEKTLENFLLVLVPAHLGGGLGELAGQFHPGLLHLTRHVLQLVYPLGGYLCLGEGDGDEEGGWGKG